MTQAQLAETLGVERSTVSQYEIGRAAPSTEVLVKMSRLAPDNTRLRTAIDAEINKRAESYFDHQRRGRRRSFALDMAKVLSREDAPEFLREIMTLYLKYRRRPEAEQLFKNASTGLRIQLQLAAPASGNLFEMEDNGALSVPPLSPEEIDSLRRLVRSFIEDSSNTSEIKPASRRK